MEKPIQVPEEGIEKGTEDGPAGASPGLAVFGWFGTSITWTLAYYLDHLLDACDRDYNLDPWSQLDQWCSGGVPQKKASLCSSRELRDTNDPGPLMKPHNTLQKGPPHPVYLTKMLHIEQSCAWVAGGYVGWKVMHIWGNYITGHYIAAWKAMQIWGHTTRFKACPTSVWPAAVLFIRGHFAYGTRYYGHYIITAWLQCNVYNTNQIYCRNTYI